MADTANTVSEPSSDSSFDSSISDDPSDYSQEEPLEYHKLHCPEATSVAPPNDMETELPEEDPDPVMEDANMSNSSTTPLSSVGDQQQTLGTGPPTAPLWNPHLGFCLSRLRWVGIIHSSWYHKTHHSQYWCLHQPKQMPQTLL